MATTIGIKKPKKRSPKEELERKDRIRINIDLPVALLERVTEAVRKGAFRSRNGLIVRAVEEYMKHLEDSWIDQAFARMADDREYQLLNLRVAEEFENSDSEAFRVRNK